MTPHQWAQYLFDLVSVDLVVSLNGNSPIEMESAVFPMPVSGVGFFFTSVLKCQEHHYNNKALYSMKSMAG